MCSSVIEPARSVGSHWRQIAAGPTHRLAGAILLNRSPRLVPSADSWSEGNNGGRYRSAQVLTRLAFVGDIRMRLSSSARQLISRQDRAEHLPRCGLVKDLLHLAEAHLVPGRNAFLGSS
jgi:hypothetical protein